jgi:hypothetical protein
MRQVAFAAVLILAMACASGATRPSGMPRPEVEIRQNGSLFFGSGSTAPAFLEVFVTNPGSQPLMLRRVRIESPGMATYGLQPIERVFSQTIAPGETRSVQLTPTAVTSTSRPTEPLTLRATVYFESGGKSFREIYTAMGEGGAI